MFYFANSWNSHFKILLEFNLYYISKFKEICYVQKIARENRQIFFLFKTLKLCIVIITWLILWWAFYDYNMANGAFEIETNRGILKFGMKI